MELSNLEKLYDIFDDSIKKLYDINKGNYLELICQTADNLSNADILNECNKEDKKELESLYEKISDIEISVDDIRKCFNLHLLRAFKEQDISYAYHTPDKIAQVMAFIAVKLIKEEEFNLLDPCCGTGNLIFVLLNNLLKEKANVFACDIDNNLSKVCNSLGNLLDYKVDVYNQDTLTTYFTNMDLILSDLSEQQEDIILYHLNSLKDNAYMVLLVDSNILSNKEFSASLFKEASLLSFINFDKELFKGNSKSIMIIKKEVDNKNCLLMEIPSFEKKMEFSKKIFELQDWLERKR